MELADDLIRLIIEKESWEDIIYYIVNVEKIDPWNVDLTRLCSGFISFIRKATMLDFRIPAKIVFVAALLLRLKAEQLSILEEEEEEAEKPPKFLEPLNIDPSLLKLAYPLKRLPKAQITLEELITALKKVVEVEQKRKERSLLAKANLQTQIVLEEDMSKRAEKLLKEIEEALAISESEKISFRQLVGEWKREPIIGKFLPLLYLEKEEKIRTEQPEFFKDFWIKPK